MIEIKVEELKREMVKQGFSEKVLARKLCISRRALRKILAGKVEFKWRQIRKIAEIFCLNNDEIIFIFFDKKVS